MSMPSRTPKPSRLIRDTQITAMPVLGTALMKGIGRTMGRLTTRMKMPRKYSLRGPVNAPSRGRDTRAISWASQRICPIIRSSSRPGNGRRPIQPPSRSGRPTSMVTVTAMMASAMVPP